MCRGVCTSPVHAELVWIPRGSNSTNSDNLSIKPTSVTNPSLVTPVGVFLVSSVVVPGAVMSVPATSVPVGHSVASPNVSAFKFDDLTLSAPRAVILLIACMPLETLWHWTRLLTMQVLGAYHSGFAVGFDSTVLCTPRIGTFFFVENLQHGTLKQLANKRWPHVAIHTFWKNGE